MQGFLKVLINNEQILAHQHIQKNEQVLLQQLKEFHLHRQ
jgi:hypothetical protein